MTLTRVSNFKKIPAINRQIADFLRLEIDKMIARKNITKSYIASIMNLDRAGSMYVAVQTLAYLNHAAILYYLYIICFPQLLQNGNNKNRLPLIE